MTPVAVALAPLALACQPVAVAWAPLALALGPHAVASAFALSVAPAASPGGKPVPVVELPQVNASAGAAMNARPAAAPEASTRPRNAPPASALVESSARWEGPRSAVAQELKPVEAKPIVNRF
jgi:hypothetical protein